MDNPWLGLKSYEEGDRLYGRNKEADELANIVMHSFHTIIYGKSGIGKTSLLRAGVFPTLRYEDYLPIYIRLEHDNAEGEEYYLRQIENALQENQCSCSVETGLAPSSGKNIEGETWRAASSGKNVEGETWRAASLQSIFARYKFSKSRGIELTPVIVFDQFEEIFTLNDNKNSAAVERFFADLSDILNGELDGLNYRLVFCLREDYLYYMERLSESIPAFKRNRYCLQDLTHDEAMEVITLGGVETEHAPSVPKDVAEEILRKISPDNSEEYNATILSLYMSQLFDKMVKAGATTISSALVQQFGDDIISAFYFESIDGVSERSIEYLEDHLVTTGGYRHNVPLEDAVVAGVRQSELERLKSRRIINVQPRQGNVLYMEYAHDVLCPIIVSNREKRALRKKAKHLRRMVAAWVVFVLFMVGVAAGIGWQAVQIKRNNRDLEATRDSLLSSNEAANREKMEKQIANDSLLQARLFLAMTNEDLQEINEQLKGEKDNALRKNQAMMLMQSRAIAGQAEKLRDEGKLLKGVALCLRALPRDLSNPDRPISYEALDVLYSFLYTDIVNCSKVWNSKEYERSAAKVNESETEKRIRDLYKDCNIFVSPNGRYIAVSTDGGTVKIWNVTTGQQVKELTLNGDFYNMALSPDGQYVAIPSSDSTVNIWNVSTGKREVVLKHDGRWCDHVSYSNDGKYIVTAASIYAYLWNPLTGELLRKFEGHKSSVGDACFSPDGRFVATSSYDDVRIWNIESGEQVKEIKLDKGSFNSINYTPDGRSLLLTNNYSVYLYNIPDKESYFSVNTNKYVNSQSFTPNGEECLFSICKFSDGRGGQMIIGELNRKLEIYNAYNNKVVNTISDEDSPAFASYSPNGKYVVVSNYKNTAKIWNVSTGEIETSLKGHTRDLGVPKYSPDGKYIVAASEDSTVRIWNALAGTLVRTFKCHTGASFETSFSPNSRYVAALSDEMTVNIWDVKTGNLVNTLKGHTECIYLASFSPDGEHIVTTSSDGTARIWNVITGKQEKVLKHTRLVLKAYYSPDGRYVVTSSLLNGESAKIWDVATGRVIHNVDKGRVYSAAFTPDGRYVVTSTLGKSTFWRFYKPQEVIDHFRKVVGDYEFTEDEEIKYYLK